MTITERHSHHFQVADVVAWDLDEDRSIAPSIQTSLKYAGIEAVVDGDEINSAGFTVYTYRTRETIRDALEKDGIELDE